MHYALSNSFLFTKHNSRVMLNLVVYQQYTNIGKYLTRSNMALGTCSTYYIFLVGSVPQIQWHSIRVKSFVTSPIRGMSQGHITENYMVSGARSTLLKRSTGFAGLE